MSDGIDGSVRSTRKIKALYHVATYRPKLAICIICLSVVVAILEGIGLGFIIPVVEIAQGRTGYNEVSGMGRAFISVFEFIGMPFTLEWVMTIVSLVMITRYVASFLVDWLRAILRTEYQRHLQSEGFENALNASIAYYDEQGSDEILNAIITQADYASNTISGVVRIFEQGFLSLMYLAIAIIIAPWMTILTGVVVGGGFYGVRRWLESGYSVGDRIAEANERVQESVQAGTQGIRETKLFGLTDEIFRDFRDSINLYAEAKIRLRRNQSTIENAYRLMMALAVFGLIYAALSFTTLSLASLGVFLIAVFRLAPRLSALNNHLYSLEGDLPHLVRTQQFVKELKDKEEVDSGKKSPPDPVDRVSFENVEFRYDEEQVLDGLSFEVDREEFVAFVGPSGAGKSTIAALLARLYEPDSGQITAASTPIDEFVLEEWRDRLSLVRQDPHIFNDTLRYNITIGDRTVSEEEIRKACENAEVTEFLDELPNGLETNLGDDGVRLSGGQRQRVALARALLKDADFLVLDEATSDLDSNIEERVHRGIENMERDYGMIVIAHRLSTVINADRIYTIEDGAIKEEGGHDELIEQDGIYADLYATQTT